MSYLRRNDISAIAVDGGSRLVLINLMLLTSLLLPKSLIAGKKKKISNYIRGKNICMDMVYMDILNMISTGRHCYYTAITT